MKGVTYGGLDAVLRSFGMHVREIDGDTRVYTYPGTEALLTVPIMPDGEQAHNFYVMGAKGVLDSYGIASADEVTARLVQSAGPAPARA